MRVDVWSDVVCPWCYIGKRRLEAALERFPHRDAVQVIWHSFQLDPTTRSSDRSLLEVLSEKYQVPVAQARAMQAQVTAAAAAEGLAFDLDAAHPENTFDAHRLVHLAAASGHQDALKERLLAAYFVEGKRIGDPTVLRALAIEAGLPADDVDATLSDPSVLADRVKEDISTARSLGVRGVPFFLIDQKLAVSGAQPPDALLAALSRAWADRPAEALPAAEGCDDDGCAVPTR